MKITQEVREFARLQEQGAAAPSPLPRAGEGDSPAASGERAVENSPDALTAGIESSPSELEMSEAQAGMAEMSKRFHDEGGEIYVPATE
jgi:hypothetical protein